MRLRIAVVGSGIAGLSAAWLASRRHDVTLFEADDRLGGHTHTHEIAIDGRTVRVDSGFIVHNPLHYPLFTRMLEELGVASQPTTMGFSVHDAHSGLEYNATTLDGLFCQRRNLLSPRFIGMVRDLLRFYREAPRLLEGAGPGPTLADYLDAQRYGDAFREQHLVPMASALWSSSSAQVLAFPARYLVQFMANHQMLQVDGRPQWRVVRGGSSSYVQALRARWSVAERPCSPVHAVLRDRDGDGAFLQTPAGSERFDHVVLACHADQALRLLGDDADAREREILGAFQFQANDAVLHTDTSLLPRQRKAWAAWNARVGAGTDAACSVSYCMNLLQGLDARQTFVVTLNGGDAVDPARVLRRMAYRHPVHSHASVAAQARKAEIQGRRRTWFAGAWWGWGFHEDGMRSGVEVAHGLGVDWTRAQAVAPRAARPAMACSA